jgi:glutamate synthase (NADPH/NADH) large chain
MAIKVSEVLDALSGRKKAAPLYCLAFTNPGYDMAAPLHDQFQTRTRVLSGEKDRSACGVGTVVSLKGEASHQILQMGLGALASMPHRVGLAPDQEIGNDGTLLGTSDGAGIVAAIPQKILKSSYSKLGHPETLGDRNLAVAAVFLPRDYEDDRARCKTIFREELIRAGYEDTGKIALTRWRRMPIKPDDHLGKIGQDSHPHPEHLLIPHKPRQSLREFDADLYVIQRRIENRIREERLSGEGRNNFHILSMSARTIVYKSLSLAHRLPALFPDLKNPEFVTPFVGFHGRFSTNTAPAWWRAHFKRILAHNGEINTLKGNINAMYRLEAIFAHCFGNNAPYILKNLLNTAGADTDILDNAAQFLYHAGVSLPLIKSILVSPAIRSGARITPDEALMYRFTNAVSPSWEGPGMFIMTDGKMVLVGGDLNGMRPTPYEIFGSADAPDVPDILVAGSERGMVQNLPQEWSIRRGDLEPGDLIGANINPENAISGQKIPVGFMTNEDLKAIAIRQCHDLFGHSYQLQRMINIPRILPTANALEHGGPDHG